MRTNVWDGLSKFIGKIRPQIFLALLILGVLGYYSLMENLNEVTVGCIAGVIALSKDLIGSAA